MKGDMELGNTPKLPCVCACIHQSSEQSLSLTPEGYTALLLGEVPHLHKLHLAVHLCSISPQVCVAEVCSWLVALPQAVLVLSSNETRKDSGIIPASS